MKIAPLPPVPVRLEPLASSDLAEAFRLWSDREAVALTNWTYTPDMESCAAALARTLAYYGKNPLHFGPYAIRLGDGRFAGIIGADASSGDAGSYDLWYFLAREERGKGIAGSAAGSLLERMKSSCRVREITATAVVDNAASWKLLERLGFERRGRIPGGHNKEGLNFDLFEYAVEP